MRILFYDTKNYDKVSFEQQLSRFPGIEIEYVKGDLAPKSAVMAKGYDAVCAFVSSDVGDETLKVLHENGVHLVLMRCAGFNNVDCSWAFRPVVALKTGVTVKENADGTLELVKDEVRSESGTYKVQIGDKTWRKEHNVK